VAFVSATVASSSQILVGSNVVVNQAVTVLAESDINISARRIMSFDFGVVSDTLMTVNGIKKWQTEGDVSESWISVTDQATNWVAVSDVTDNWNDISNTPAVWTSVPDSSQSWQSIR
jgi:hypothetical protein